MIKEMKYEGFMVIISNNLNNVSDVFNTYRRKDVVEKSFDNFSPSVLSTLAYGLT